VLIGERGVRLSGGRYCFLLRHGRYRAVGDEVLCADGRNWAKGDNVVVRKGRT